MYLLILKYILNNSHIILMCIYLFKFFFANDLSVADDFIFILDYGTDVRQKANLKDFLI